MKIVNNNTLVFDKNDGVFLAQLALTAMSAKSMKEGKGPVTSFPGLIENPNRFFGNLQYMTFDLRTRRFQVPKTLWPTFIARKAAAKVNGDIAQAEAQVNAKVHPLMVQPEFVLANQIVKQQVQNAGVQQVEMFFQMQAGLTDDQMKMIREIFLPILREVVGWPGL